MPAMAHSNDPTADQPHASFGPGWVRLLLPAVGIAANVAAVADRAQKCWASDKAVVWTVWRDVQIVLVAAESVATVVSVDEAVAGIVCGN